MTPSPGFIATLRRALWPLLVFEAAIGVAVLILLDPLLVLLMARIVALSGDPVIGNTALITFVLSPLGMLALVTAATGTILVNVIALGGVSLILWHARQGLPTRQSVIWRSLLRRLPVLIILSGCTFAAMLVLALPVPLVAAAARHWFLSAGDLYFYISTRPPEFLRAVAMIAVAAAASVFAGLYVLLRAGLALPICLLRPIAALPALHQAVLATAGRTPALLPRLFCVVAGLAALWIAALAALSRLLVWLLSQPVTSLWLNAGAIGFIIITALIFAVLAAMSRAAVVLVLIADSSADHALPQAAEPAATLRTAARLRLAVAALFCVAIPAAAVIEVVRASQMASFDRAIEITAHRAGSAHAPENTLAALKSAIAARADVVEIDVQETADGKVVVLHDTDLRRVAGMARSIWEMRLDELQNLDVGSWFSPAFHGERIPTLLEFASAARGKIRLNVELKNNGRGEDLAARTIAALREAGAADEAAISSLDMGMLHQVRRTAPEIKLGLILATSVGNLRRADVDFFALSRRLATPAVIRQLQASGREVHVWTLDDEASIARAMLDGADDVITGNPRLAVAVRDWFEGLNEPERVLLSIGRSLDVGWLRTSGSVGLPRGGSVPSSADDP
jgi:glycerophosphoryl diester phosphodiesterase